MRHVRALLFALSALATSVLPAAANVVQCPPGTQPGVICLSGPVTNLAGGGPLVGGQVYHVLGELQIPGGEALTIEDGAIVKFSGVGRLRMLATSQLSCGAAVFTSITDDSAGGDTNGDGASVGMPGSWEGLSVNDATIVGAQVRFAQTGLLVGGLTSLDGVVVQDSSGPGLDPAGSTPRLVTNCSFVRNRIAITRVDLANLAVFTANSASANELCDSVYVTSADVRANTTLSPANTPNGLPVVLCRDVIVRPGVTLDLQPGLIVKFGIFPLGYAGCGLGGFDVRGTLFADQVIVTSLEDDTLGGDTAKDGPTLGTPGNWGRVVFQAASDASLLRDTLLRFGGDATLGGGSGPAIDLTQADISLERVSVVECEADALHLRGGSFPLVSGCSFLDNLGRAVAGVPIAAAQGFSACNASNNALDAMVLALGTGSNPVVGYVPIDAGNALNADGVFIVDERVPVTPASELELGAGVIFKWRPGSLALDVEGTLTTHAPVVFTSLTDDDVAGDTNKDGAASGPEPGDWTGLSFSASADASVLDGARVRYAGKSNQTTAAVVLAGADIRIENSSIERSETAGLGLGGLSFPTVLACAFDENRFPVSGVAIAGVPRFQDNTAQGNALGDYLLISEGDVSLGPATAGPCAVTIGPANALAPHALFVADTDIDVPAGCLLSMLAGTVLKWDGNRELDVDGSVQLGSLGGSVVLTSIEDDSILGDTRKDGFSEGTPGDWGTLRLDAGGSVLQDVVVRFAGSGANSGVVLAGVQAQLSTVQVLDCAGTALQLSQAARPVVDGCDFQRNVRAVDGAALRALPGFSNNSASDNTLSDTIRITEGVVPFDLFVRRTQSLDGRPLVLGTSVNVLAGTTLSIGASVVLKFEGGRGLDVQGTLECLGAPETTIFTTLLDDIAGDTNKDMDATLPVAGLWNGLVFGQEADASQLTGVRVRYAAGPSVLLTRADILLSDSAIEFSSGAGVSLANDSRPRIQRTRFDHNAGFPIASAPLDAVGSFLDNIGVGNDVDAIHVGSADFDGTAVVARHNALNDDGVFVVDTSITLFAGDVLELRQGTLFKWRGFARSLTVNGGALVVEGTGLEPVVLTSIRDDGVGGDTEQDGAATQPAPGDWQSVSIPSNAAPSRIEHLVLRYGGRSDAAFLPASAALLAHGVRVDYSGSDGVRARNLAGDALNWVAFQSAGDGIDLDSPSDFALLHATVSGSGGVGIRRRVSASARLESSIAFGNAGGELSGFTSGDVTFSNAGPDFAGQDGNLDTDPLFVDAAAGDLRLRRRSPSIDSAAPGASAPKDHVEASRILDHDLDGLARADMGAYERGAYTLEFAGRPRVGTTMNFSVQGPAGFALYTLGPLGGETFVSPLGFTLYGAPGSGVVLGVRPVGVPLELRLPAATTAVGELFGVQALARPMAGSAGGGAGGPGGSGPRSPRPVPGNHTNLYRARLIL